MDAISRAQVLDNGSGMYYNTDGITTQSNLWQTVAAVSGLLVRVSFDRLAFGFG